MQHVVLGPEDGGGIAVLVKAGGSGGKDGVGENSSEKQARGHVALAHALLAAVHFNFALGLDEDEGCGAIHVLKVREEVRGAGTPFIQ